MNLNSKQYQIIAEHTLREYPKEAVIGITQDDAIPLPNIHNNPEEHFKVHPKEFYDKGFIALIHSHTYNINNITVGHFIDVRSPSEHDMQSQIALNIPFGIVGCDGTEVSDILWFPQLDVPLAGHRYICGVFDCFGLVRRYYHQYENILLDEQPRGMDWQEKEPDIYSNRFKANGFYEIDESELEVGDLVVIKFKGHDCHGGIYMGNNKLAHHLDHRLSLTDDSFAKWRSKMSMFLRHKDKNKDRE